MASGLYIDARQLQKGAKGFERLAKEFPEKVSTVLNGAAEEIVRRAKDTVQSNSSNTGDLARGIRFTNNKLLEKHITSRAPYSAYVEFGTGKYAAQYVSSLPADYAAYAATFRGKGGGTFKEFIKALAEWVRLKGLAGTYSVKTRRRTGRKANRPKEDLRVAYAIAISILRNGVHPQPFMIPALIDTQPKLVKNMAALINRLKIV